MATNVKAVNPLDEPDDTSTGGMFSRREMTKTTRALAPKKAAEPVMHALRRLFGDGVLEVIPKDVRDAVDAGYKNWQEYPDEYWTVTFDSPQMAADALLVMRAYGDMAGANGYTIRTLAMDDPCTLAWQARDRITRDRGKKGDESDGDALPD